MLPSCPACGLDYAKADSGDGPAVLLTFVLGFIVVPPLILFGMWVDWPLWAFGLVSAAVILGATLGTLRPAKALMIGLQYRHRRDTLL